MIFKTVFSITAIFLLFLSYIPYIRNIIKGSIRPHIFSYLIWFIITLLVYILQVKAGGGVGSWVTLVVAILFLYITILSIKKGKKDIRKIDIFFLGITSLTIPFWLLTDNSIASIVLLASVDVFAYLMTFIKSYYHPYSENTSLYIVSSIRYVFVFFSMENYNLITLLIPVLGIIFNLLIGGVIFFMRNKVEVMKT